jgi:hypothetical protein
MKDKIEVRIEHLKSKFDNNINLNRNDIKFMFKIIDSDNEIIKIKTEYINLCENEINRLKKELRFRRMKCYPECLTYCKDATKCQTGNIPICD